MSGWAQVRVTGQLATRDHEPVGFASVQLLMDSTLLAGALSREDGTFELSCICPDTTGYLLRIRHLSTLTYQQSLASGSQSLGTLVLEADTSRSIETVSITAAATLYERRADRFVFFVENSPLASGGDGLDALSLTPGLLVTQEAINLAGRGGVIITVNNRTIALSGTDLIAYLRALPAANIKKIEVIANPDARYEAEGSSGIINIVMKKPMGEGWEIRSSSTWEQRSKPSFSENLSFNLRKKALNLYGFYNPRMRQARTIEETEVNYADSYWLTNNLRREGLQSHSYQLGADMQLGDRTVLGLVSEGVLTGRSSEDATATTNVFSSENAIDSVFEVTNTIRRKVAYQAVNANIRHQLDTIGSTFSADLDFFHFVNTQRQDLGSLTSAPGKESRLDLSQSDAPQEITNYSAKFDFSHVLPQQQQIEWGAKVTRTITTNDFEFRVWDGQAFGRDPLRSNEFRYTEDIQAAYVSYDRSWDHTQLELGLRGENTLVRGESLTLDTVNTQQYFRVFPSIFVQRDLGDNHKANLYYGIRLSRPEFWELNPFKYYLNPYTYSEGNPALRPSFTHNLELTYSFKDTYSLTIAGSVTENHFQQVPVVASGDNFFYYTRDNVGTQQSLGISIFAPFSLSDWWKIDLSAWAALNAQRTPYLEGEVAYVQPYLWTGLNQRFIFSEKAGLSVQINSSYSTRNQSFLYQQEGIFLTNVSLRKDLFKGKGSLNVALYDVFYTFPYRVNVDFLDQQMSFKNSPETRYLQVTFSYRFGQDQVRGQQYREKGNQQERSRSGIR